MKQKLETVREEQENDKEGEVSSKPVSPSTKNLQVKSEQISSDTNATEKGQANESLIEESKTEKVESDNEVQVASSSDDEQPKQPETPIA